MFSNSDFVILFLNLKSRFCHNYKDYWTCTLQVFRNTFSVIYLPKQDLALQKMKLHIQNKTLNATYILCFLKSQPHCMSSHNDMKLASIGNLFICLFSHSWECPSVYEMQKADAEMWLAPSFQLCHTLCKLQVYSKALQLLGMGIQTKN